MEKQKSLISSKKLENEQQCKEQNISNKEDTEEDYIEINIPAHEVT